MSIGTVTVRRSRVRDIEERFESRVLPLFKRRTETVSELIRELYLHGLTTAWAPQGADGLDRLEIRSSGALLFILDQDAIDKMTSDLAPSAHVVWRIRQDDVVPTVEPQ